MKALVVVDYQNDFVDGSLGFEKAKDLEGPICGKIEEYLARGDAVFFTKDCHEKGDYPKTLEGRHLPVDHCFPGHGQEIYGKVARYANEGNTIRKSTFGTEELCARLSKIDNLESVELCGLVSSICVISNAVLVRTRFPEIPVIVDARCTGAGDESMNAKALDIMQNLFVEVVNRSE